MKPTPRSAPCNCCYPLFGRFFRNETRTRRNEDALVQPENIRVLEPFDEVDVPPPLDPAESDDDSDDDLDEGPAPPPVVPLPPPGPADRCSHCVIHLPSLREKVEKLCCPTCVDRDAENQDALFDEFIRKVAVRLEAGEKVKVSDEWEEMKAKNSKKTKRTRNFDVTATHYGIATTIECECTNSDCDEFFTIDPQTSAFYGQKPGSQSFHNAFNSVEKLIGKTLREVALEALDAGLEEEIRLTLHYRHGLAATLQWQPLRFSVRPLDSHWRPLQEAHEPTCLLQGLR